MALSARRGWNSRGAPGLIRARQLTLRALRRFLRARRQAPGRGRRTVALADRHELDGADHAGLRHLDRDDRVLLELLLEERLELRGALRVLLRELLGRALRALLLGLAGHRERGA